MNQNPTDAVTVTDAQRNPLSTSPSAPFRTLLRRLGQVVLQPNAFTGVCPLTA
ncbi:hypothetical protein [Paraburkholderia sp.]|jgi:hypothetical protein|uniref:hypothetical protein n=1 Tax=Paraburkholderia sp. TaxID=1926495 RepID=UPI002F402C32